MQKADRVLTNGAGYENWLQLVSLSESSIVDTSRGKRSAHVDLMDRGGTDTLRRLTVEADVFVQGYRPGTLAARGFDPVALAELRPGIICVSLSAYGNEGPWGGRRGFDSLVQTATGFNHAEAAAAGSDKDRGGFHDAWRALR